MGTSISWTDETWNPVVGCERVSPGCAHCYAKTLHDKRHKAYLAGATGLPEQYALPFESVQLMPERLEKPLHWKKPRRIFVNSVSDLFHADVPDDFICKVFTVMRRCPQHIFQVLTKRPERMRQFMSRLSWHTPETDAKGIAGFGWQAYMGRKTGYLPPNVWLGVSVENQRWAVERIPLLLKTPASVRFLSCEPLLGPLDLRPYLRRTPGVKVCPQCLYFTNMHVYSCPNDGSWLGPDIAIDWVIVGGESGKGYRPMDLDWVRKIRDHCASEGVPFFFKQGNGYRSEMSPLLDGKQYHEFPEVKVAA